MRTNTVNENKEQGEKDLATQFLNAPYIFKCLNKFLHGDEMFSVLEIRRKASSNLLQLFHDLN